MNGRLVWFGCVALAAGYGCAGDHFDEECPAGTVKLGTKCVVPAPATGGTGGKGGAAGGGGQSGTGPGGAGNAAGGSAGAAAGTAGTSGAGKGGGGGAAGTGGSSGGGGGGAGTAGASGVGGAGAAGAAGSSAAGSAGASGSAGKAGTGGAAGSGGAGAKGGAAGATGTGGGGAGSGGAGGGGASGGGTAGSGGGGSSGGGGDAGASGSAGSGGTCVVSSCTADECYVPTCDGPNCSQAFAEAGTTCGTNGICNGKGVCGDCKPGNQDCSGKTPRTCAEDGKWVDGTACDIACTGAGVCATVASIAQGPNEMCARLSSGTVTCWGDPTTTTPSVPVDGLEGVVHLAAASGTFCAVKGDGTVWCWGANAAGAMGQDIAITGSATPLQVPGLAGAKEIFGGFGSAFCASQTGNAMTCWGDTVGAPTATTVPNPTHASLGDQFGCIRTSLGEVWCWGRNWEGQCGTGATGAPLTTPTKIATLSGVVSLSAGRQHVCAQTNVNTALHCWGGDTLGSVGDGAPGSNTGSPVAVLSGLSPAYSAGTYHVCAVQGAAVKCWGQLGATNYAPITYGNVSVPIQATGGSGSACGVFGPTDVRCWKKDEAPSAVVW